MAKANAYEPLFKEINRQLELHGIIVKTGAIVDASVVDTPLKPKGKTNHKVTKDRKDTQEVEVGKDYPASVDTESASLKKSGKYRFGHKKHHVTDNEGLVLGVLTIKASTNEISNLEEVLDTADLPENIPLKGDKGYQSKKECHFTEKAQHKKPYFKESLQKQTLNSLGKEVQQTSGQNKVQGRAYFWRNQTMV